MRRLVWVLCLGWLDVGAAAAECRGRTSGGELRTALQEAENAYAGLDAGEFREAERMLSAQVPCLEDVVDPSVIARLHRVTGLAARIDGQLDEARLSFAAARSIDPEFGFPPDSPVSEDYEVVPIGIGRVVAVEPPLLGTLYFDGDPRDTRPVVWPSFVQYVDENGAVKWSAYLQPSEELPPYPVGGGTAVATQQEGIAPGTALFLAQSALMTTLGIALYGTTTAEWNNGGCGVVGASETEADVCNAIRPRFLWGVGFMAGGAIGLAGSGALIALEW